MKIKKSFLSEFCGADLVSAPQFFVVYVCFNVSSPPHNLFHEKFLKRVLTGGVASDIIKLEIE